MRAMKQHKFPEGITKKVLQEIYGISYFIFYLSEYEIKAKKPYDHNDLLWTRDSGFDRCPTWVYQELVKRGLAPEIINEDEREYNDILSKINVDVIEQMIKYFEDKEGVFEASAAANLRLTLENKQ